MKTKGIIIVIVLLALVVVAGAFGSDSLRKIISSEPVATTTPVVTPTPGTMTIKVFFGNHRSDPDALYCERAYPALREVAKTESVARVTINELLKGPTEAEKAQGFFTTLNSGVVLQSLSITDGVAKVDFSSRLGEGVGGSCLVTAIRAQITETLKQFPAVSSVIISIDGQVDEILQP